MLSDTFTVCSAEFAERVRQLMLWDVLRLLWAWSDGELCFRRTDYVVRPSTGEEKRLFQEQVGIGFKCTCWSLKQGLCGMAVLYSTQTLLM